MLPRLIVALALLLAACEGPMGPQGEQGEQGVAGLAGPKGDPGEAPEGVFIEVRMPTESDYDEEGRFAIAAGPLTPANFRGLFVKVRWTAGGVIGYVPFEYLVSLWVSVVPEERELIVPVLGVEEGQLEIIDPARVTIQVVEWLAGDALALAVLISE